MMIYGDNMIAQKITSNVIINTSKCLHSSMGRKKRNTRKYNNQQRWLWNYAIIQGRETMMINSNSMIAQQGTSNIISKPNEWSHSREMRKQRKTTKNNNQQRWRWNDAIVLELSGMTSFTPPRANPPVSRFFSLLCCDSRADFPRTFRETGGINRETF